MSISTALFNALSDSMDIPGFSDYLQEIDFDAIMTRVGVSLAKSRPTPNAVVSRIVNCLQDMEYPLSPFERQLLSDGSSKKRLKKVANLHPTLLKNYSEMESGVFGPRYTATYGGVAVCVEPLKYYSKLIKRRVTSTAFLSHLNLLRDAQLQYCPVYCGIIVEDFLPSIVSLLPVGVHTRLLSLNLISMQSSQHRLTLKAYSRILCGIVSALAHIEQELGDVIPINIISYANVFECDYDGRGVKLVDPGISYIGDDNELIIQNNKSNLKLLSELIIVLNTYNNKSSTDESAASPEQLKSDVVITLLSSVSKQDESVSLFWKYTEMLSEIFEVITNKYSDYKDVELEIPFPDDNISFDEWSVSPIARKHILNFRRQISSQNGSINIPIHTLTDNEIFDLRNAIQNVRLLRSITLSGPSSIIGSKPSSAFTVFPYRKSAITPSVVANLHKNLFLWSFLNCPKGYHSQIVISKQSNAFNLHDRFLFSEYQGIRGPPLYYFINEFGSKHPDFDNHIRLQNLLWFEYLKAAGVINKYKTKIQENSIKKRKSPLIKLGGLQWKSISEGIRMSHIEDVNINCIDISTDVLLACREIKLTSLNLSSCNISSLLHSKTLCLLFKSCKHLSSFSVEDGLLGDDLEGFSEIVSNLISHTQIQTLSLIRCGLPSEALSHSICSQLLLNISFINLSDNVFGDVGALQVAVALRELFPIHTSNQRCPLNHFNISSNDITEVGCVALITSFQMYIKVKDNPWVVDGCLIMTRE